MTPPFQSLDRGDIIHVDHVKKVASYVLADGWSLTIKASGGKAVVNRLSDDSVSIINADLRSVEGVERA